MDLSAEVFYVERNESILTKASFRASGRWFNGRTFDLLDDESKVPLC
jgi:hypothetical protein